MSLYISISILLKNIACFTYESSIENKLRWDIIFEFQKIKENYAVF